MLSTSYQNMWYYHVYACETVYAWQSRHSMGDNTKLRSARKIYHLTRIFLINSPHCFVPVIYSDGIDSHQITTTVFPLLPRHCWKLLKEHPIMGWTFTGTERPFGFLWRLQNEIFCGMMHSTHYGWPKWTKSAKGSTYEKFHVRKHTRIKSFVYKTIRVSKVSCIKWYAYQKFRV